MSTGNTQNECVPLTRKYAWVEITRTERGERVMECPRCHWQTIAEFQYSPGGNYCQNCGKHMVRYGKLW